MAKGSQSQASSSARGGSGAGGGIPRATTSASAPPKGTGGAGLRRRRTASSGSASGSGAPRGGKSSSNMLQFYTDDAPGLKIPPTVVLIMSLVFIGFVTLLHVVGKFYGARA